MPSLTSTPPWVNRLFRSIGLLGILLISSCGSSSSLIYSEPASASGGKSYSRDNSSIRSLEKSLNRWRSSIGREPIDRHAGLDRLAQQHCEFMARNRGNFKVGSDRISHMGFDERAFKAQRMYGMGHVSENVAGGIIRGDNLASQISSAWINSGKHAYNLRQKWDYTGYGMVVQDDGMVYVTQLFATKAVQAPSMGTPERFRPF